MKVADNAEVRQADGSIYFRANLDTYGGNSGSGVWLESTHELVGILVRAERTSNFSRFRRPAGSNAESQSTTVARKESAKT